MKIHREGKQSIILGFIAFSSVNLMLFFLLPVYPFLILLIISSLMLCGLILFFRVPERKHVKNPFSIISPADGRVLKIKEVYENEYFKKPMTRISIFMSITDVHLNRIPVDGKIVYVQYHPGRYLLAFHPKSSELNEHNTIVVETDRGHQILVRQIAGGLARRVRCFVNENEQYRQGDEMGFIKFGSRADVFIPDEYKVSVVKNQKVKAGVSVLAVLKEE
ncbi:MAG TPA: phosphatidylserine decarboxylase family protein [Bacteroidia bacterium]|nr:phosphatidylserine decarboxylase family protein [Bacteroidia bacterium]HRS58608.1 phosphatidylserine decarboxylase family protein [Bacteroidia bacterium]HRU68025.1 phosphatidylserine decarboxylase family protein [Bacteroidia bacterium]